MFAGECRLCRGGLSTEEAKTMRYGIKRMRTRSNRPCKLGDRRLTGERAGAQDLRGTGRRPFHTHPQGADACRSWTKVCDGRICSFFLDQRHDERTNLN
jgi:hypothetical protein